MSTNKTPSECCWLSNVSNTLSRIPPFFASNSWLAIKYSTKSRKLAKNLGHFQIWKIDLIS